MAKIIRFPGHARPSAGSRAASRASKSAVIPADRALSVAKSADHHSDGILSRFSHLRTAQAPAPTSAAKVSRESQRSMMERNESKSDMTESMGHSVPKIKAVLSHDINLCPGHSVLMLDDIEKIAETEWREAFRERVRKAQGGRTQSDMAKLLGISRDSYAKYVGGRGSVMPVRLLPQFCRICDVDIDWLIEGAEPQKSIKQAKTAAKPARMASRR